MVRFEDKEDSKEKYKRNEEEKRSLILTDIFLKTFTKKLENKKRELILRGNDLFKRKGCRLADKDVEVVCAWLMEHPEVTALDLSYNRITDAGMFTLVSFLGETDQLSRLNIMCNDIGWQGAQKLAELEDKLTLRSLRINGNKIGSEGGKYLALLLGCNSSLQHLDVGETDQTASGLSYLTTALRSDRGGNGTLQLLDLSRPLPSNNMHQMEGSHLAESIGLIADKNSIKHTTMRVLLFQIIASGIPLPPQPVLARWGTWLDAVNYYADHYGKIMEVIDALDSTDSSAVAAVKSLPSEQLLEDILFIDSNFKIVSKSIILLESSKLQLSEALNIVYKVSQTVIQNNNSLISEKVKCKLRNVIAKNSAYSQLRIINDVPSGHDKTSEVGVLKRSDFPFFKYAPITSCDVERTFSQYKNCLSDHRRRFTLQSLKILKELHLQKFNFNDSDMELMMMGLLHNRSLLLLDLTCNNLGSDAAALLAEYLRTKPQLRALLLGHNNIRDLGAT
ncbi:hypothetical protein ANN_12371 [Periplaneta americana]|uniref:Uncharacterized protein n=1 Tax=Periplaneta americana TaxID=6978 RepID=A0ABQ8THS0_PERAM|nr:hypothetical protein ANN_12371 [Periplaneta americana]